MTVAYQLSLLSDSDAQVAPPKLTGIVNVASVPLRSPFRFPGGKTWLVPHIRRWLSRLDRGSCYFVEPFAGGSIVSLTVAAENLARQVIMVEIDKKIAAVWHTVLSDDARWLADRIAHFHLTSK